MSANFHRLSPQLVLFSLSFPLSPPFFLWLPLTHFHSSPQIPSQSVHTIAMVTETVARERAIVSQGSSVLIAHEVRSFTHVRTHTALQRNKQPMSLFIIGFRLSFEQVQPASRLLVGLNSQA